MDGIRDRHGITVLPTARCWERLASRAVGRVAYLDAGVPVIVPVNHLVDGATICFRSPGGTKLDAAERGHVFGFEVDDLDPQLRTGWSVLASGPATVVEDPEEREWLEARGLRSWALRDTAGPTSWVRIRVEEITGREVPDPAGEVRG